MSPTEKVESWLRDVPLPEGFSFRVTEDVLCSGTVIALDVQVASAYAISHETVDSAKQPERIVTEVARWTKLRLVRELQRLAEGLEATL